jgi:hypothetical protein
MACTGAFGKLGKKLLRIRIPQMWICCDLPSLVRLCDRIIGRTTNVWGFRQDLYVRDFNQGTMARESGLLGRTLDAQKVIPKINVPRLVEIKEVDQPQI